MDRPLHIQGTNSWIGLPVFGICKMRASLSRRVSVKTLLYTTVGSLPGRITVSLGVRIGLSLWIRVSKRILRFLRLRDRPPISLRSRSPSVVVSTVSSRHWALVKTTVTNLTRKTGLVTRLMWYFTGCLTYSVRSSGWVTVSTFLSSLVHSVIRVLTTTSGPGVPFNIRHFCVRGSKHFVDRLTREFRERTTWRGQKKTGSSPYNPFFILKVT